MTEPTDRRDRRPTKLAVLLAAATLGVWLLPGGEPATARAEEDKPAVAVDEAYFIEQVKPLLQARCVKCHTDERAKGGLNMMTRETLLAGGGSGKVIDLEKPADSTLLMSISWKNDEFQMPPKEKLADRQIEVLNNWVMAGVPWPEGVELEAPPRDRRGPGGPGQ